MMSCQVRKLLKRYEFRHIMSAGYRIVSDSFVVIYRFDAPQIKHTLVDCKDPKPSPTLSVGIIASKKVGNAVHRNRCKRLLRTAVWECAGQLPQLSTDVACVLIARTSLYSQKSNIVASELLKQLCNIILHRRTHVSTKSTMRL